MKNIFIISENDFYSNGIKFCLNNRKDFEVIGSGLYDSETISRVKKLKPDIVFIQLHECMDGIGFLKDLCIKCQGSKIVLFSMFMEKSNIEELLKYGVSGFLTSNCTEKDIIEATEKVSKGEEYFCSNAVKIILNNNNEDKKGLSVYASLSKDQKRIIDLTFEGLSLKEIGSDFHINPNTVYKRRKKILEKFNLTNTRDLIRIMRGGVKRYDNLNYAKLFNNLLSDGRIFLPSWENISPF